MSALEWPRHLAPPATVCFKCARPAAPVVGHRLCESCHQPALCPKCGGPNLTAQVGFAGDVQNPKRTRLKSWA